ncbi:Rieske (2Fe-2S) protein [Aromatoleum bremense]|uniref:Rieske 2Fe-2S domain-containing protein n=1 Tax=Aromatoleum bremense TaxID=76115 RepID=A0ABX1NVU3_9RHOO|nr:Rieske 2Fe-2S domain-containing protein [Aromatoleum bremense]NMG16131.1 Rieske 2Fe-2S domain-containing protein [Aromatoleum bremense]QTQ30177.1 Rieske [2Fe-2S] iron-sulfur domain-containing protein [Aromatoleum bremense]
MQFVDVCALESIAPGSSRAVRAGDRDVALFNVDGTVHALENACRHAGAALSGGKLCGRVVACPAHGWKYDVTTGALVVAPTLSVARYPVRVVDGRVLVETGGEAGVSRSTASRPPNGLAVQSQPSEAQVSRSTASRPPNGLAVQSQPTSAAARGSSDEH